MFHLSKKVVPPWIHTLCPLAAENLAAPACLPVRLAKAACLPVRLAKAACLPEPHQNAPLWAGCLDSPAIVRAAISLCRVISLC